jgi:hypothetical protein
LHLLGAFPLDNSDARFGRRAFNPGDLLSGGKDATSGGFDHSLPTAR